MSAMEVSGSKVFNFIVLLQNFTLDILSLIISLGWRFKLRIPQNVCALMGYLIWPLYLSEGRSQQAALQVTSSSHMAPSSSIPHTEHTPTPGPVLDPPLPWPGMCFSPGTQVALS